jgi:hypothetical protein
MIDFEIPDLMQEFQAAFQPMMASLDGLKEAINEIIPTCEDPEKRKQFEEILQSIQQQETEVLREVPALAAESEAGIRAGMAEFQAMSGQIDALDGRLKGLDAQMVEARKADEARRLAQATEPAQLSAAVNASAYLESLRRKNQGNQSNQSNQTNLPLLRDGTLLQSKLLGILQPKPDARTPPVRAIGNIWENWPTVPANAPEPNDSEP